MTPAATVFMSISVLFVVMLVAWCYYRVFHPGVDGDSQSKLHDQDQISDT